MIANMQVKQQHVYGVLKLVPWGPIFTNRNICKKNKIKKIK